MFATAVVGFVIVLLFTCCCFPNVFSFVYVCIVIVYSVCMLPFLCIVTARVLCTSLLVCAVVDSEVLFYVKCLISVHILLSPWAEE